MVHPPKINPAKNLRYTVYTFFFSDPLLVYLDPFDVFTSYQEMLMRSVKCFIDL